MEIKPPPIEPIKTSKMYFSYADKQYIDEHFEELYGFKKGSEKAKDFFSKLDKPLTWWQKVKKYIKLMPRKIPDRELLTIKTKTAYLVSLDRFGGELFWDKDRAKQFRNELNKKLKIIKLEII